MINCPQILKLSLAVALWLTLFSCHSLFSQVQCVNYTSQNGLISDFTTCAVQDNDGYMWFGTAGGICKFDGHRFHNYSSRGNGDLPGPVLIKSIAVDKNNDVWVGSEKSGIYKFDRTAEHWTNYHQKQDSPRKLAGNEIQFLKSTGDGMIWFGGQRAGLGCIDVERDSVYNYSIDSMPNYSRWKGMLFDMEFDPDNEEVFWLTGHGSILKFDRKSAAFTQFVPKNDLNKRLSFQHFSILPDQSMYVSTYFDGIFKVDKNRENAMSHNPPNFTSGKKWNSRVVASPEGNIWAVYVNQGVASFDPLTEDWKTIQWSPENFHGLLPGQILNLYISKEGLKWVMTANGISLIVPGKQRFKNLDRQEENNFFLGAVEDQMNGNNLMAFAGNHGSFKVLNNSFGIVENKNIPGRDNMFNSVFSIDVIDNQFYLLSDRIYTYDRSKIALLEWPGFSNTLSPIKVYKDENGIFWILNRQNSITRYDPASRQEKSYRFPHFKGESTARYIIHDMAVVAGELWIAAQSELVVLNMESGDRSYYTIDESKVKKKADPAEPVTIANTIAQVMPVTDSCAWVLLTEAGFVKVCRDKNGETLRAGAQKNEHDFPQLKNPFSIIRGSNNDFWIGTNDGIVHTDEQFSEFNLVHRSEGLTYTKINHGLSRIDDKLIVGLDNGFAVANENELTRKLRPTICHINEPKLGDKDLMLNDRKGKHFQNALSAHLSSPIYDEPRSVEFAYRLNGANNEWTTVVGDDPPIRMDNLAPGKYTLEAKVRSQNRDWSEVSQLAFHIMPPYWKTAWFRTIVALLIASLAYLLYRQKLKQDLKDEKVKTQLAELQNQALRAQMNPHFIFNSLNSIKSLVLLDRKQEGVTYLTKFSRMVREVLNLSKEKTILLEKELELLQIYLDMESLRFHQKFEYNINVDPSVNLYKQLVPPLLIQPFAENSIWHGLMHKEGDAHLNISLFDRDGFLNIVIEDDGIGRRAAAQIKSNKAMYRKSSEGLKLSKNRIDLVSDHAEVEIEDLCKDDHSSGTRVTIKLPTTYGKS